MASLLAGSRGCPASRACACRRASSCWRRCASRLPRGWRSRRSAPRIRAARSLRSPSSRSPDCSPTVDRGRCRSACRRGRSARRRPERARARAAVRPTSTSTSPRCIAVMSHGLPVVNGYAGYVPPHAVVIDWALRAPRSVDPHGAPPRAVRSMSPWPTDRGRRRGRRSWTRSTDATLLGVERRRAPVPLPPAAYARQVTLGGRRSGARPSGERSSG